MKKKRAHFLLIELMMALALIGICGLYAIKPSYNIALARQKQLELLQLGRLSQEQALHVKMALLAQTITLSSEGCLPPVTCTLSSKKSRHYDCYYKLKRDKQSNKVGKKKGEIYTLQLTFFHHKEECGAFYYPLYVESIQQ